MTIGELIEHLKSYPASMHCAYHLWLPEDVISYAKHEMHRHVTKKEANEVIDYVHHHLDSSLGITWITLECAIEELL